jgi:hypothetical protein
VLFETVYGPELECAFGLVAERGRPERPFPRTDLFALTVPGAADGQLKNMQDAVTFLRSAGLVAEGTDGLWALTDGRFRPALLLRLRLIERDDAAPELDRLYLRLVHELFIYPDRLYRADLHAAANAVSPLPITQERLNAWARVLEYLGLGRRLGGGFQCAYSPALLADLLATHPPGLYDLGSLIDEGLGPYLPLRTRSGMIPQALQAALYVLHEGRALRLLRLQDAPGRAIGPEGYTHVRLPRRSRRGRRTEGGSAT